MHSETAHAELTHIAERHSRAGGVLGVHSITLSARRRSKGGTRDRARLYSLLSLYQIRSSRGFRGGKLCSRPPCPNAEGVFVRRKLAIGSHVVLIARRPLAASFNPADAWP